MNEYVAIPLDQGIDVDHSMMGCGAQPKGVLGMAGRYVECKTEDELKRIIAAGDIAVLREGFWIIRDFARVEAYNSAIVEAYDSATVLAYDSATVRAYGSATVRAYGSATVRAYGSATVQAYGSATVQACDSSTVRAYGSATVRAIARSSVRVMSDSVKVEASGWATVILHAAANVVAEPSVAIVKRIIRTIHDWADAYGADERGGKLVLYKWVRPDGCTKNGVHYKEKQMVEAPDWDPNPSIELGFGLHACATLEDASEFRDPPRLAVELLVDPDDCRAPQPDDIYPHKVRFRRAFVSRVWDADSEAGGSTGGLR